jgi:hypothetical protein
MGPSENFFASIIFSLLETIMTMLDFPLFSRIRRNHGLEHATINILSQRFPYQRLAGYSTPSGFFILGDISTDDLREAVLQALARMKNGEHDLALHEHCGTNYAAAGFIVGLLAWFGMAGTKNNREKVERLPLVITLITIGLIASQPLGVLIQQRITTSGEPEGMSIQEILPIKLGSIPMHRVTTRD